MTKRGAAVALGLAGLLAAGCSGGSDASHGSAATSRATTAPGQGPAYWDNIDTYCRSFYAEVVVDYLQFLRIPVPSNRRDSLSSIASSVSVLAKHARQADRRVSPAARADFERHVVGPLQRAAATARAARQAYVDGNARAFDAAMQRFKGDEEDLFAYGRQHAVDCQSRVTALPPVRSICRFDAQQHGTPEKWCRPAT